MRPEELRLILASGSPRRDELLTTAGLSHEVIVSGVEEDAPKSDPCTLVETLSAKKAEDVFHQVEKESNFAVIGADTVVALDGRILGKMTHSERIGENVSINIPVQQDMHLFRSGVKYFA